MAKCSEVTTVYLKPGELIVCEHETLATTVQGGTGLHSVGQMEVSGAGICCNIKYY